MSEVVNIFNEIRNNSGRSLDSIVNVVNADSALQIDIDGNLPLHKACERGSDSYIFLKTLVKFYPEGLQHINAYGYLPIHILLCKSKYIRKSDEFMECLKFCVDNFDGSLLEDGPDQNLPLHFAVSDNSLSIDVLKFLIASCPESVEQNNENYDLPLHLAAAVNASHLVELLIQKFPLAVKSLNNNGNLPLHRAASYGKFSNTKMSELLLRQFPRAVEVANKDGNLPLHLATEKRSQALASLFFEAHPNGAKVQNKDGNLPIHFAALANCIPICRILSQKYPETVKVPNNFGCFPLHCAAKSGGASLCKDLIEIYPEAVEVPNKTGNLPLHLAAEANNPEVFRILIEKYPEGATILNTNGRFPCNLTRSVPIMADIGDSCPSWFQAKHQAHVSDRVFSYLKHECPGIAQKRLRHIEEMFNCATYSDVHAEMSAELEDKENDVARLTIQLENHKKQATAVTAEHHDIYDVTITSFRDSLKNEQNQHKQTKAREKELGERLQNLQSTEQSVQSAITTSNVTNSYYEARNSELYFLSKVNKMKECLSVEDLKPILLSLNSRLTDLKKKVQPGSKPSNTQKYVKCMFSLCAKGEDMKRDDICEAISDINKELVELEGMDDTAATANHCGADTPARAIKLEDDTMAETPVSASRKRTRANISPSSFLD